MTPETALRAIQEASEQAKHGLYLGAGRLGPVWAEPEQAVLVLGPPRSGKTTSLVVPSVLAAWGTVISTSTKPDVLHMTLRARMRKGPCLVYDPTGTVQVPAGAERVRWSPVTRCVHWDEALLVADRLVRTVRPAGAHARSDTLDHWTERAQALLAPLLHAAALDQVQMADVVRWVDRREASAAMSILVQARTGRAVDDLAGVVSTEPREQSAIWSTASSVLAAYRSDAALATTAHPDFDPVAFCNSGGTLYVCATGSRQALAAPLVVNLLSDVRDAAYARAAQEVRPIPTELGRNKPSAPLVLALDEVANIAPLPDLPSTVSEGGGQGVVTLACLQDLSQARARWGERAEGFMSLFGTTVVLPGIADTRTLEALSMIAGDHDVRMHSVSAPAMSGRAGFVRAISDRLLRGPMHAKTERAMTVTASFSQRRRLPPDLIARGEPGKALTVDERNRMSWVSLTRCHESVPWRWVVNGPDASVGPKDLRPSVSLEAPATKRSRSMAAGREMGGPEPESGL